MLPLLEPGEHTEAMVHLIAGSARFILKHRRTFTSQWQPVSAVEFGVLTTRRFVILAADSQGRPTPQILLHIDREGCSISSTGGGYIRWADVKDREQRSFRIHYPIVARREARQFVNRITPGSL
jgi:hypothetical protein